MSLFHLHDHKQLLICFYYRLSRARRCIENAFGILSSRWRVLRKPLCASLEICEAITQATVVLHNFLQASEQQMPLHERRYCPTGFADYVDMHGRLNEGLWRNEGVSLKSVNRLSSNNYSRTARTYRDILSEFFVSKEGWVSWQEDYVNRGGLPN